MILTRRSILGAAAASLASGALGAPRAPIAEVALRTAIAVAARKSIAAKGAPGISVAVARGGRLLLEQSFGFANLETATLARPRSIFRIGSLTKQFTAAAVLRLQEQGRLKLEDPVAKYLPAFAPHPRIAVAELMHHSAGLHSEDDAASCPAGLDAPLSQVALANTVAAQKTVFDFPPGTAWLYSNANYIVLGAIVESVSGRLLASALNELVLKPLVPTTLALDRSDVVLPDRASGYSHSEEARFVHAGFIEISEAGGAGAMRGTASDLVRWHQALIAGKILTPVSLAVLLAPGRLRDGRLSGANRFSPNDANYGDVQYGGGLLLSPAGARPRTISHNGFINGFSAVLETSLDSDLCFAILANADVGQNLPFRDIRKAMRAFESHLTA